MGPQFDRRIAFHIAAFCLLSQAWPGSGCTGRLYAAGLRSGVFPPASSQGVSSSSSADAARSTDARDARKTPVLQWKIPSPIHYATALSAAQLDATSNVAGTFAYNPARGAILDAGAHTLKVTFTPVDTTDYTTATASVTLTVERQNPALRWATPGPIHYGTALSAKQLNATANLPGVFAYNPRVGTLLEVGSYTLNALFTPSDTANYATAVATVKLTVEQAKPVLAWPAPPSIVIGEKLGAAQLDAVATAPGSTQPLPGTYLYSPPEGTAFSSTGPQALHLEFTPDDTTDYTSAQASVTLRVGSYGLVAWGDSLSLGHQGILNAGSYPDDLESLIVLPIVDEGIGGQTSTQIGVREGSVLTYVTVSGGVIPASGGVTVIFPTGYQPVTVEGPVQGVSGTILGVHGRVLLNGTTYTFVRTVSGSMVSVPGSPRFVVDTPYASYLPVFWEGRNNVSSESQVLSDLAAQVANVAPGRDYLILSVPNMNVSIEWLGGEKYPKIIALNNALAGIYGSHFIDVRRTLVESYNPSLITDASDHAHDEPPTSLRPIFGLGTLGSAIGAAETSFKVDLTSGDLIQNDILTIGTGADAENVQISSFSGDTVTVVRSYGGNNTSHHAGDPVTETDPIHLNAKGYEIVAKEVAAHLPAYRIEP
jgi:hypothetical protein